MVTIKLRLTSSVKCLTACHVLESIIIIRCVKNNLKINCSMISKFILFNIISVFNMLVLVLSLIHICAYGTYNCVLVVQYKCSKKQKKRVEKNCCKLNNN